MKNRPKIQPKIKAKLQKEIHSECPFCQNQEVEYFEIHHIDENPKNNDLSNLIMICSNCHTKITKGDISQDRVLQVKTDIPLILDKIEFVSATIDSKSCAWEVSKENEYAFFKIDNKRKSPFPVINFTLINHRSRTIVLKKIHLKVKDLPRGISGIPQAKVLKSLIKYSIEIKDINNVLILSNPIHIPANESFMFQIELTEKFMEEDKTYDEIQGRKVLYFSFEFSDNIVSKVPNLYLNCNSENEKMRIMILS
jgi:HNH endonuclease